MIGRWGDGDGEKRRRGDAGIEIGEWGDREMGR
jgi:hypothetical protein